MCVMNGFLTIVGTLDVYLVNVVKVSLVFQANVRDSQNDKNFQTQVYVLRNESVEYSLFCHNPGEVENCKSLFKNNNMRWGGHP